MRVVDSQPSETFPKIGDFATLVKILENSNGPPYFQTFLPCQRSSTLFVDQDECNVELLSEENRAQFTESEAESGPSRLQGTATMQGSYFDPCGVSYFRSTWKADSGHNNFVVYFLRNVYV